jgi:hypothetical protein
MRRAARHAFVAWWATAAGALCTWACTTFDFPAPDEGPADATTEPTSADARLEGEAAAPTSLLSVSDAGNLCARIFECPRLADAIALSTGLPLDTPSSPLSFSACMDWVAGPINAARIGLAELRSILQSAAYAASCDAAYLAMPVRPLVDAGARCAQACLDLTDLLACEADAGAYAIACAPPVFGARGLCIMPDSGPALCVSTGGCTRGLSCPNASTLRDCFPKQNSHTDTDCTLTGRQCATLGANLADCVVPPMNTAPCPVRQRLDDCDPSYKDRVRHCTLQAQTEIDCAAVGRTCTTGNAAHVARCASPSDTCTPFDRGQNRCSGDAISICVGGVPQSFDCKSVMRTCVPGDATHTAHCI